MKRTITTIAVLALGLSFLGACGSDDKKDADTASGAKKVAVTIGSQPFGESEILAEIYKQGLAAKGFATSIVEAGGYRPAEIEAFKQKRFNFAAEYAASMLEGLNDKKGEATGDVTETVKKLEPYLTTIGLTALAASDAVDTNAFVVTKETSDKLGIKSLSDLASKGKDLKLAGPSDCETNPFCIPGLKKTYGLDMSSHFTALDSNTSVADLLDQGKTDVGLLFSTDGRIASKGYVLLEDDKQMLAADNVVPLVSIELGKNADLREATDAITAKLTTEKLVEMNKAYDIDKEDAATIAKQFLEDEGLI